MSFKELDITQDQQALQDLVDKYQSRATPTIVIEGQVVMGFDRERLEQLLAG